MKFFLSVIALFFSANLLAQANETALSYNEYISLVLQEHPLVMRAGLQEKFADAESLKARGYLDPKLKTAFNKKEFDDKNYYQLLKSEIKIPTVLGFDVKANFENNFGEYVNAENTTANKGLWSVGVEMDVLRNWSFNERKAALNQAEIMQNLSEVEQNRLLNELIVEASSYYFDWFTNFEKLKISQENIILSEKYLENTIQSTLLGDKPAIDTIEAQTILYDQRLNYQQISINYIKAKLKVNNYLWDDGRMTALANNVVPLLPAFGELRPTIDFDFFENHPDILVKEYKANQIDLSNRLAKQDLLPEVKLGYFPLINTNDQTIIPQGADVSNYKIGASFVMPLFRRKEKATLMKGQLKLEETQYEILDKQNQLFVKWQIEQNALENYEQQFALVNKAIENYQALVDAEFTRYEYGESSVFLVNKRLEKLLESRLKRQEIQQKIFDTQLQQLYLQNALYE